MLEARHVSISFGGLKAVDDASLIVPAGTITSLIGPNGAGKSTLFGILSGFLEPDAGSVSFLGRDVTGLAPHRGIGDGVEVMLTEKGEDERASRVAPSERGVIRRTVTRTL